MGMNISLGYSQFYKGTEPLKKYGHGEGAKDTLVKYEFNTRDAQGNKVMEQMSREETLQAMRDIRSCYGDNVIVEFSGDGMAALVESKGKIGSEGGMGHNIGTEGKEGIEGKGSAAQQEIEAKNAAFQKEIKHIDKSIKGNPAYSWVYEADKAVAAALEKCSEAEQGMVYDVIRQNFLIGNRGSMTEGERLANISLGMKKAESMAETFIPEGNRASFLEAMGMIAKLARAGKADVNGNMDYGVQKGRYLGHGSNLVYTTNAIGVMQAMDSKSYEEYQKIDSSQDEGLGKLKYLTNWYANAVRKRPFMIEQYEKQRKDYILKILV